MLIVQSNSRTTTASKLLDTNQLAEQLLNKSNTIEDWRIKGVGPRYKEIRALVVKLEEARKTADKQSLLNGGV